MGGFQNVQEDTFMHGQNLDLEAENQNEEENLEKLWQNFRNMHFCRRILPTELDLDEQFSNSASQE